MNWLLRICFEIDWICVVVENDVNMVYVELKIEILSCWWLREWFELLWLWIGIVDMDWSDEFCELFVFDGNELVV